MLTNGDFSLPDVGDSDGNNISKPTGWSGSGNYRAYKNTDGIGGDATNQYVRARDTGDRNLWQRGSIDAGTTSLLLEGWFGSDDTDNATVTLTLYSDAGYTTEYDSVTATTKATGWNQIGGASGLSIDVDTAVAWQVRLDYDNVSSSYAASRFDDLTLTAVPEPSSAALIGLGGVALILRRRK